MKKYRVEVRTGDRDSAGTDADMFIQLIGPKGRSSEVKIDNSEDNFERGKLDTFEIEADDVGWIDAIHMRHNNKKNKPGWFCDWVKVTDISMGLEYKADFYRWLAVGEEDGKTEAECAVLVTNVTMLAGNVESCFLGYNAIRKSNESNASMSYNDAFTYTYKEGVSLKKTTGVSISTGAKVGAEFFGAKCEFTLGVTATITKEMAATEEQSVTVSSTASVTLGPNESVTMIALYFQNVLKGQAEASGMRMEFEDKFTLDQDTFSYQGILSDSEVQERVREILQTILGTGGTLPKILPSREAFIPINKQGISGNITLEKVNKTFPVIRPKIVESTLGKYHGKIFTGIQSSLRRHPRILHRDDT